MICERSRQRSNGTLLLSTATTIPVESIEMKSLNSPTLDLEPPDCCPKFIFKRFLCCQPFIPIFLKKNWKTLRSKAHRMVEHRFFEWLIIASILASSTTLVSYSCSSRIHVTLIHIF